jgi:hypothetical protein
MKRKIEQPDFSIMWYNTLYTILGHIKRIYPKLEFDEELVTESLMENDEATMKILVKEMNKFKILNKNESYPDSIVLKKIREIEERKIETFKSVDEDIFA